MAGVDDPIKHVVVLAMENRSFDHILGGCVQEIAGLQGIDPAKPASNLYQGKLYQQLPKAAPVMLDDPIHEYPNVMRQLGNRDNSGFVQDYAQAYPALTDEGRAQVMYYHPYGTLSALHTLAKNFAVCDNWFSSVPGPTWTNRLFLLSGTSLGRVKMADGLFNLNLHWYNQPTIFDRLNEKGLSWRVYFGDAPLSLLFVNQWEPENAARYRAMTEFQKAAAAYKKDSDNFPAFSFIEPAYLQPGANDDHPPHDLLEGEVLIASVYNSIRSNADLWNSTLLVVVFDEHGGFYDRVIPPDTIAPDHHTGEYTFDRLGVRVPAILISPYVVAAPVHTQFDHTSLLKYFIDKWELGPLGNRAAVAKTLAEVITPDFRGDTPQRITVASPKAPSVGEVAQPSRLTGHQTALVALSHVLESITDEDPNVVAARSRQVLSGPQSQVDAAVDRVDEFLRQQSIRFLRKTEGELF